MLSGKSIKCRPYRKDDIVLNVLENRQNTIVPPMMGGYSGVIEKYTAYLDDEYIKYDVPLEGGLSHLSGKSAGKYLCCWQSMEPAYLDIPETGTAIAGGSASITLSASASPENDFYRGMVVELTGGTGSGQFNIITGYNGTTKVASVATWTTTPNATSVYKIGGYDSIDGADVSIHSDVVVMGVKISEYGAIEKHNLKLYVKIQAGFDYNYKLTFKCLDLFCKISGGYVKNAGIYNCGITAGISANANFMDCKVEFCNITTIETGSINLWYSASDISFQNNLIENKSTSSNQFSVLSVVSINISIRNCVFKNFRNSGLTSYINVSAPSSLAFNFQNCYIIDSDIKMNNTNIALTNIIYIKNSQVIGGNINTAIFQTKSANEGDFYIGVPKMDFDTIEFSDMAVLYADLSAEYITDNTRYYGRGARLYYNIAFNPAFEVKDELKKFSEDYLFVVERDDIEKTLTPSSGAKKIRNFGIYGIDGITAFDFQHDENFLIKCVDDSGNVAVFCYFNNSLRQTVFSDVWDGRVYTIVNVFQIWEIDNRQNLCAVFSTRPDYNEITDGPLRGTIRFNTWDNEVLL